jgi:prepilin-type N-terminal cleavage/methylation domain-containing protein
MRAEQPMIQPGGCMQRRRARAGFTLIELMVVVGILGTLSAIALPQFSALVRRSKTAEVPANLNSMFKGAASYYLSELSTQGQTASVAGHCTVDDAGPSPASASAGKQPFTADASFRALAFQIADTVYFSYGIISPDPRNSTSQCDRQPNTVSLYTFYAWGDLDGDGVTSRFELAAGSDATNQLYHQQSLYIRNETE